METGIVWVKLLMAPLRWMRRLKEPLLSFFLDESNKFIGNLFTGGLNILPLNYLEDGRTVIDLENLILDGTSVIPSHNPIGDEIDITEEEVIRYREIGAYYESLAKNIDADNDGIPDILDKKELRITSHFSIFGGTWGENSTPPEPFNAADIDINYQVRIEGNIAIAPTSGSQVILSGPIDNPYNDISQNRYVAEKDCFIVFFWRQAAENEGRNLNMNLLPFQKGTYNFTLGSRYYTLNYSNIDAKYYLVIASPTFHTNSEGMVTSVTLNYILPDNTVVDPENFVTILQLQIERKSGSRIQLGSLYESVESNRTIKDITNVTIETPFPLSDIASVSVNYNDFLGNEYDVIWRKDY